MRNVYLGQTLTNLTQTINVVGQLCQLAMDSLVLGETVTVWVNLRPALLPVGTRVRRRGRRFSPQSASCLWASPRNFPHPFASSIPRHGEGGKRRGREKRGRLIPSVRRRKKYISTTYIAACAHSSKTRNGNPRNNCSIPPDLFSPCISRA